MAEQYKAQTQSANDRFQFTIFISSTAAIDNGTQNTATVDQWLAVSTETSAAECRGQTNITVCNASELLDKRHSTSVH